MAPSQDGHRRRLTDAIVGELPDELIDTGDSLATERDDDVALA
jgi:hypothetical protein